jgi:hypothetical protein
MKKATVLAAALALIGGAPLAQAAVTNYNVTQTYNQVVYNTSHPDWDTWFYGSFSYDNSTQTVSNLTGRINQAMDGGPGVSAWVNLNNQLSSVAVDTNADGVNDGLVVSVFKENTTNVFTGGIYGTGGFGPNGLMGPVTTYGNQNAFVSVFVNLADPTAALSQSQLNYIAYGDCTPAALMPRNGSGTKCMAGWNGYANGVLGPGGTMQGTYPNTQTITAAVPEPETYAMMMAGLGMVGWMSRRRRRVA